MGYNSIFKDFFVWDDGNLINENKINNSFYNFFC